MISFKVDSEKRARKLLESVKLISYAESLGGVEPITYPMLQTHGMCRLRQENGWGSRKTSENVSGN